MPDSDALMPDTMDAAVLDGLVPLAPSDQARVTDAVATAGVTGWSYFFPYLLFFSQVAGRERLLFETERDSVLVYRLRLRSDRPALSLLVPPFPFDPVALARAEERMAAFNPDRVLRVSRVSEGVASAVARHGYELRFNADEYVYDQRRVRAMEGRDFATLRRKVRSFASDDVRIRPYAPTDRTECMALLSDWRETLAARGVRLGPYRRYARKCLEAADTLGADILRGEVVEIHGRIGAFTFGGPINPTMASLFVTISDHRHAGLAYLQRRSFIAESPDTRFFNDGLDSGRFGLAQMKRAFRPTSMHALFSARRRAP